MQKKTRTQKSLVHEDDRKLEGLEWLHGDVMMQYLQEDHRRKDKIHMAGKKEENITQIEIRLIPTDGWNTEELQDRQEEPKDQ